MQKPKILLSPTLGKEKFYIDAVENCGGQAVALYCPEPLTDCDGLILCGGNDVNPALYGEDVNGSVNIDFKRDEAEIKLAEAFINAGKPVFGICRGYQLLNVLFGGSLIQHLDNADIHRTGTEIDCVHEITVEKDSLLHRLYGQEIFSVNSAHHQAIKEPGKNLKITATHENVIESYEHELLPVFGVQFHPERMCFTKKRADTVDGSEIFRYFIKICNEQWTVK